MPKPTTGHVNRRGTTQRMPSADPSGAAEAEPTAPSKRSSQDRRPEPDTDQMAVDTLMTSVFTGIFLIVSTIIFGTFGAAALALGNRAGQESGARAGLAVGLAVGLVVMVVLLRHFAGVIKLRSRNLYRGMWIGMLFALGIIVVMAYLPQVVFPKYCPPGPACF